MNLNTAEINGFVYGLGGCQDKLMTQVVQADPFRDSVGRVGLLWVYCRVVGPVCSCSPSSAENKSTNLKHTVQGSSKLLEVT